MRILIDADTIVEILLNRSGIVEKVESLWNVLEEGQIEAYLSDIGADKIRSFAEHISDPISANEIVLTIQKHLQICPVDEMILQHVRLSALEDYESAVEVSCALALDMGAIVTHKPSDFAKANFSIISVGELPERQHLEDQIQSTKSEKSGKNVSLEALENALKEAGRQPMAEPYISEFDDFALLLLL
ncbi:hypothetical protein IQ235_16880 [Oscillatoriales cyanobacterium LEGE 11467]|uniref:PIN domain-containing protein n=1 Tax=Zarconia navalis LEGE 11467 TaxID=1828826 RepID=A0A928W1Z8_9CYAN|nr:PIN domain-containing protein [Zarconia navalis]MBE9042448.1 hypothetical protein [Zarconia navalis LEGE 11467]